ncbi:MAG TPA: response regulator transcription factor [Anaerolineales bacterium]|nr:response regulator transcription factor [Anaerolineales bacterium]
MITVIVADDHHLVRKGIRGLLEEAGDIEVVAEAEDGQQAVELVERHAPDVLLVDIAMPRLNGIQAAERIRDLGLPTRAVILSMHSSRLLVRQALRGGAKGYLLKRSVTEELLLAVRAASRDETYLSPPVSGIVAEGYLMGQGVGQPASPIDQLTSREREVLQLIAEGYTSSAIAERLRISTSTADRHRANLMAKLDVHDIAGLTRMAIKYGLVFLEE